MTDDFEILLDPAPRPSDREPPAPATTPRGIPEVTRPRSRLAMPALLTGAALLTLGFVYSVSSAGEAAPTAGPPAPVEVSAAETPPPPPARRPSSPIRRASRPRRPTRTMPPISAPIRPPPPMLPTPPGGLPSAGTRRC